MNYRSQIERLIPKAETGEQWAEICRLEILAIADEEFCACGNAKHGAEIVCRECL